jgi:hypothetical protein
MDRRKKNTNWTVADAAGNSTMEGAQLAVLMDIRDELQRLNLLLHCANFLSIPRTLRTISRKLPTRRRKRS